MTTQHLPRSAQAGISERPPEHLILAAINLTAADPAACHAAMERLRALVRAELHGEIADAATETGELGYQSVHSHPTLTVTVGLSSSGYDKLGATTSDQRPLDLHRMPADIIDSDTQIAGASRPAAFPGEGDVLLKISANDVFLTEHVLRRVEHELSADFTVIWVETGAQRYGTRQTGSRQESRALIGFLDGTANLHPAEPVDRALIFTDHTATNYPTNPMPEQYNGAGFPELRKMPDGAEPAVLDGGSYLAVEVLLLNTAAFDQVPRETQEAIVGRSKIDGSPAATATSSSHVLKANPHRPGSDDEQRRILRRGYPLIRATAGHLSRGLILLAYGRSLTTQHEFVHRAWIDNPNFPTQGAGRDQLLSTYVVRPLEAGGYYFVPPLTKAEDKASWRLPLV